jgi:hypothetical protein
VMIDAYMHTDAYRRLLRDSVSPSEATTRLQEASPQPASSPQRCTLDPIVDSLLRHPEEDLDSLASRLAATREQVDRVASNIWSAAQEWHELQQTGVQIRRSVIVEPLTDREKQYVEKWRGALSTDQLTSIMQTPGEMIDALVRTLELRGANAPPASGADVGSAFNLARDEWERIATADIESGQRRLRVELSDATRAFVARWDGTLSPDSLTMLMMLPEETLAGHMRLFAHTHPGWETKPARSAGPSPQPGPSGHQQRLTAGDKARVLELSRDGRMSPSTIAAYVGKPAAEVKAYLDGLSDPPRNAR